MFSSLDLYAFTELNSETEYQEYVEYLKAVEEEDRKARDL
jgi:hypothetical protein